MRHSTIIQVYGIMCAVERKPSFRAQKSFKIGFRPTGYAQMLHCSEKSVWTSCLVIFSQMGVKSGVWKTASILSSGIPGFLYSPRSYMMNVLYLLTQPVAPPRGHHHNGQERCLTNWKEVVMPQILFGRVFIM